MKKTLLIDLDGVLNQYKGDYNENYIPNPENGVEKFLKELNTEYNIVIFTTRNNEITKAWLKENSLDKYVSDVTNIKKPCFLYIDDRAICHNGDYTATIEKIKNFKPHWYKK